MVTDFYLNDAKVWQDLMHSAFSKNCKDYNKNAVSSVEERQVQIGDVN